MEIVCINSLYLQQYPNFNGQGYISEEQLNNIENEMGWDKKKAESTVRIAIMHHHYIPTCKVEAIDVKRPSSVVYDADRLMKWLTKNDVKVLLHGHKHTTFHAHLNYPVIDDGGKFMVKGVAVIGLGSTACESTKNVAALLKITKNTVKSVLSQITAQQFCTSVETDFDSLREKRAENPEKLNLGCEK